MKRFDPIIYAKHDGLELQDVGKWSLKKYQLVGGYCDLFTKTMRGKWKNLVYIDLYSGSGYSKIRDSNDIVLSSPLVSLSLPEPFDQYIFCEQDNRRVDALRARCNRDFRESSIDIHDGDVNEKITETVQTIPAKGTLCFCFVDPFSVNLNFSTIRTIAERKVDFLILLALQMDAQRNLKYYINEQNDKISRFLDDKVWRDKFNDYPIRKNADFIRFLANQFEQEMVGLSYKVDRKSFERVRTDKKIPIYYLAFFSKSDLGNKFWGIAQRYANPQQKLNL